MGTALKEEAENVLLGKGGEDGREAESSCVIRDYFYLGSSFLQGGSVGIGGGFPAKDQQIVICGADELRFDRQAEMRVEDDAEEGSATRHSAAVGELGIIGKDGANAREDGVAGVSETLDFGSRFGAGEPVWLVGNARGEGRCEFAVGGECGLQSNKRRSVLDEMGEGVIEVSGLLFENAEGNFDAGAAEFCDTLTADLRVRVLGGDNAARDTGRDESVGTGAGAAVVTAGLECDICGGALGGDASGGGLFEGDDFGVVAIVVEVGAFADDFGFLPLSRTDEDATYLRVWGGEAGGLTCELEGSLHEGFIVTAKRNARHDLRISVSFRMWRCSLRCGSLSIKSMWCLSLKVLQLLAMPSSNPMLTPREAARLLGVSYATIKQWTLTGKLKTVQTPGGHHRLSQAALRPFLLKDKTKSEAESRRRYRRVSGRNQLSGKVVSIRIEGLLAEVVLMVGDTQVTAIITANAVRELQLKKGDAAAALIKSTDVMIERLDDPE